MKYLKLFTDFTDRMTELNDSERGRLFVALLKYAETGVTPELRGNEKYVFSSVKVDIDAQRKNYESVCDRNQRNINSRYQTLPKLPKATKSTTRSVWKEDQDEDQDQDEDEDQKKKKKTYSASAALNEAIEGFIEFRKKIKKPMTDRAIELLIKELNKLSDNEEEQIAIINQSILNGWQGVFALKKGGEGYGRNRTAGAAGKEAESEWNIHYDV